jgi:Chaperone of endosialidase
MTFEQAANWFDKRARFFANSPLLNGSESGGGLFPRWVLRLFRTRNPRVKTAGKKKGRTMNPLTHCKNKTILPLLIPLALALAWLAVSPTARGVDPPPDGCYLDGNTAEGCDALFSLTNGNNNTAIGNEALFSNTTGDSNTATGAHALPSSIDGDGNTATGAQALQSNETGDNNTATGAAALAFNETGDVNTATGSNALQNNTTGSSNTANGFLALFNNTTGGNNIALGNSAGRNLTTGSNNIDIGNVGVAAESNTIRIGTQGTQTATFIAGISGTALGSGVAVRVNANGQLGTVGSSARFKQNIKPMDKASEALHALKPVTFHYKKELEPEGVLQFGLVAEDVEEVNPELVARDAEGKVYTVRYEAVNAMLLNEFLKEHRKVEKLEATVASLAATVKEQVAQIQRVSTQLELNKPAPQTVLNQ